MCVFSALLISTVQSEIGKRYPSRSILGILFPQKIFVSKYAGNVIVHR